MFHFALRRAGRPSVSARAPLACCVAAVLMAPSVWAQRIELLAGSTFGYHEGQGAAAQFSSPVGLAVDSSGQVFVSEMHLNRIRKIAPDGTTSLLAGSAAGTRGSEEGVGADARFDAPIGLALNASGDLLLVADSSNQRIRRLPVDGTTPSTTLAGSIQGYAENNVSGSGTSAQFNQPYGVALDANGNALVTEFSGHRVRQITPNGLTTLLAGDTSGGVFGVIGDTEGTGAAARFAAPFGIAVRRGGQVLVADHINHRIRQFMPGATTSTLAGSTTGFADGSGPTAQFNRPAGIALDDAGRLFVAEYGGHRIRMVLPDGTTSTIAGTGVIGAAGDGGPASQARLNGPTAVVADGQGNLFVADFANNRVRKIILIPEVPSAVSAAAAGAGQAAVSWTAAPLAMQDDVQRYRVTASTGQTCTADAPATTCTVTGLPSGTTITFGVIAINRAGFESPAATLTQGPLVSATGALPNATQGLLYTAPALVATGGRAPYTWAFVSGSSLPAGLTLDPDSGVISGTPTGAGSFTFSVTVTDADRVTSPEQTLSLSVAAAALPVPTLGGWALALLGALMAGLGLHRKAGT